MASGKGGAVTAIAEARKYLEDGNEWVVDMDLEKFFDRVNHDRLMSRLEQRVKDRRLVQLIRQMLEAKVVMPDGVVVNTEEGTPQGGPLSPLLSNIVLDELDEELSQRGLHFVRYADDCNIYVRSERAGQRVMASVSRFIERRLRLKVNSTKSAVARPEERHFLGFRLRRAPLQGEVEVLLSKRSKERIDEKIRELTPRTGAGHSRTASTNSAGTCAGGSASSGSAQAANGRRSPSWTHTSGADCERWYSSSGNAEGPSLSDSSSEE